MATNQQSKRGVAPVNSVSNRTCRDNAVSVIITFCSSILQHAVVWWAAHGKFNAQYGAVSLSDCSDGRSAKALLKVTVHEPVRFKYGKYAHKDGYNANIVVFCSKLSTKYKMK